MWRYFSLLTQSAAAFNIWLIFALKFVVLCVLSVGWSKHGMNVEPAQPLGVASRE